MKYPFIILLFVISSLQLASQASQRKAANRFSLSAAAGLNVHSYTINYPGWYLKLGAEYKIWKGLTAGIRIWHSDVDEFPARLKMVPFSAEDEANFIQRFIGITEKEWKAPNYKGFYHSFQGDILSLSLGYAFRIRQRFFITPQYAINVVRSRTIVAGLYEAWFVNDRLITGKVYTDIRFGNLAAGSIGLQLGYRLNDRWKFFADLEDIRDLNGTGWINYEAKNYGAGIGYTFK